MLDRVIRNARLRDGPMVDIGIAAGRISAVMCHVSRPTALADCPALVTSCAAAILWVQDYASNPATLPTWCCSTLPTRRLPSPKLQNRYGHKGRADDLHPPPANAAQADRNGTSKDHEVTHDAAFGSGN
jgi:hypothetical protein